MSDAATAVSAVPEAEFARVYAWAMRHVLFEARGRGDEYRDALLDAATDGLLWVRDRFDPAFGRDGFRHFAERVVRQAVSRAKLRRFERGQSRPGMEALAGDTPASPKESSAAPLMIADLPDDLAFVVRLTFVDEYDLRDCGLLTGAGPNAVQAKLRKAAALLAPGRVVPARAAGARRLGRT